MALQQVAWSNSSLPPIAQVHVYHKCHRQLQFTPRVTAKRNPTKTPIPWTALSKQSAAPQRRGSRPKTTDGRAFVPTVRAQVVIIITMVFIELNGRLLVPSTSFAPPHLSSSMPLASSAGQDKVPGYWAEFLLLLPTSSLS